MHFVTELKILFASKHTLTRWGFESILNSSELMTDVVGTKDLAETEALLSEHVFDLVVLDLGRDPDSGFLFDDLARLKKEHTSTPFLVVISRENSFEISKVVGAGVSGCLTRICDPDEFIDAVRATTSGAQYFCVKIVDTVFQSWLYPDKNEKNLSDPSVLSSREIEVTRLIADGLKTKELADKLGISFHTAHTHRRNILKKVGVRSSSELIRYAIDTGIVQN